MELFLMVAIGAVVVCFLKGRRLYGILTLIGGVVAVVGGSILSDQTKNGIWAVAGLLLFLGAATFGAFRPAVSGSVWLRSAAVGSQRERGPQKQPTSRRLLRTGVGAVLGMLPALLFMFGIVTIGSILGWSSDTMQVSFAGIPFLPLGFIVGAIIGYRWVPRKSTEPPTPAAPKGEDQAHAAPRNSAFTGAVIGVLVGMLFVVVDMSTGITQGWAFVAPLILILSGAIGAWWGNRHGGHSTPPSATPTG